MNGGSSPHLWLLLLFLVMNSADAGRQGVWQKIFTVDVAINGQQGSLIASSANECGVRCLGTSGCRSFGVHPGSGACLLYDQLVGYTTTGTPASGMCYYWYLSPRCPTELGYRVEAGACVLVVLPLHTFLGGRARCREDGGHLMVADTREKLDFLGASSNGGLTWVGASDRDAEGNWTWVNGRPVDAGHWVLDEPDNLGGDEDEACFKYGGLGDGTASSMMHVACQIHMATS